MVASYIIHNTYNKSKIQRNHSQLRRGIQNGKKETMQEYQINGPAECGHKTEHNWLATNE